MDDSPDLPELREFYILVSYLDIAVRNVRGIRHPASMPGLVPRVLPVPFEKALVSVH